MSHVTVGDHALPAVITMMPLIDLNPSDETTVYSTVCNRPSQKLGVPPTPCIMFDQPLRQKAVDIAMAEKLNIVCRMGGLHMSFLGSIDHLMSGSGLDDMLKLNYGKNTVSHIMSGKAVFIATRGHFIVAGALTIKLIERAAAATPRTEQKLSLQGSVLKEKISTTNSSILDDENIV